MISKKNQENRTISITESMNRVQFFGTGGELSGTGIVNMILRAVTPAVPATSKSQLPNESVDKLGEFSPAACEQQWKKIAGASPAQPRRESS